MPNRVCVSFPERGVPPRLRPPVTMKGSSVMGGLYQGIDELVPIEVVFHHDTGCAKDPA
jgi:hypothetical protein